MKIKYFLVVLLCTGIALGCSKGQIKNDSKMKIIYVYDALCGWCYGFSDAFQEFYNNHESDCDFEVVSGGMVTGDRVGPIGEVAGYISWAYKDVEKSTGVKFGKDFLDKTLQEGDAIFTSIPAARAMAVFRKERPDDVVAFAARLQKAIYYDGKAPLDWSHYGSIAADFGLDAQDFVEKIQSEEALVAAKQDFQRSGQLGVTGFPTVFVETPEGQRYVLCRGYASAAQLENQFTQIHQQVQQHD